MIQSWESGMTYTGTVDSVSDYPSQMRGWSEGNNNVTYYGFTVFVDGEANLRENEYVDMRIGNGGGEDSSGSFYLEKPFVLQESGKTYVYVMNAEERLEKRELVTGRELWGSYIEVLGGLEMEENIAFPYGKYLHEGAKVKISTLDELYSMM
jgi:hypothetical protein